MSQLDYPLIPANFQFSMNDPTQLGQWSSELGAMVDRTTAFPLQPTNSVSPSLYQPDWMDKLTGWKGTDGTMHAGYGGLALGAAQGLFNGWLGMQQYGLAKDQLNFQKDAFAKNWQAQKQTVNTQLQDRQAARVASREGASTNPYQSVGAYMQQNGIA